MCRSARSVLFWLQNDTRHELTFNGYNLIYDFLFDIKFRNECPFELSEVGTIVPVGDNDMIYVCLFEMTYDKDDFRCLMTDDFHLSNSYEQWVDYAQCGTFIKI